MTANKSNIRLEEIGGFPEFTPEIDILMNDIKQKISKVYEKYGYQNLDTRLVEPLSVLQEKGIDSKEVFCLKTLSKGEIKEKNELQEELALRFDMTVPLARYIGQNQKSMFFPYKRYNIGKVYRAETARPGLGRYCEFYQSDIDVIGNGKLDLLYDAEFPLIINDIFRNILGLEKFIIRINNRKFLEGFFQEFGINEPAKIKASIKIIDNIEKVSLEETIENLSNIGIDKEKANLIFNFFKICKNTQIDIIIKVLKNWEIKNELLKNGIDELCTVFEYILNSGMNMDNIMFDPSIARGLDYYTGTVYETLLIDFPALGSVCSGGRYDNLVGTLSNNSNLKFPGCGISIGLTRLIPTLVKAVILNQTEKTVAQVMVSVMDRNLIKEYQKIAKILRDNNINTIVYYNDAKLKNQLNYADNIRVNIVVVVGENEFKDGKVKIQDMRLNAGKKKDECVDNSKTVQIEEMIDTVTNILNKYKNLINKNDLDNKFRKYSNDNIDDTISTVNSIFNIK
jgi:histidyl-tRNA synthetase